METSTQSQARDSEALDSREQSASPPSVSRDTDRLRPSTPGPFAPEPASFTDRQIQGNEETLRLQRRLSRAHTLAAFPTTPLTAVDSGPYPIPEPTHAALRRVRSGPDRLPRPRRMSEYAGPAHNLVEAISPLPPATTRRATFPPQEGLDLSQVPYYPNRTSNGGALSITVSSRSA